MYILKHAYYQTYMTNSGSVTTNPWNAKIFLGDRLPQPIENAVAVPPVKQEARAFIASLPKGKEREIEISLFEQVYREIYDPANNKGKLYATQK